MSWTDSASINGPGLAKLSGRPRGWRPYLLTARCTSFLRQDLDLDVSRSTWVGVAVRAICLASTGIAIAAMLDPANSEISTVPPGPPRKGTDSKYNECPTWTRLGGAKLRAKAGDGGVFLRHATQVTRSIHHL
jgi:hypothetical protein